MRSLKKLLAVLLALTMVLSIMVVPAFAAESLQYEDEAKILYDLGLFKGKSTTEFVPDLESRLERQDGVALLLRLFSLDAEAEKMSESEAKALLAENFKDADKIAAWAVKYVAYAVKNEIVNGRPDGNFAPNDPLLGKEYAKMVLALLGQYDPNNFQTACADLAAISDLSAAEAIRFNDKILIRDDVVGISYASLTAQYADGSTVIAKLAAANPALKAKALELGLIEIVKINTVVELISIKVGEALNLPAKAEVEYSDGSVAEVALTWDTSAVKTDVAGEYKAVGSVAGFDGKIEAAITVTPDTLAVESVTADNLKEVVVTYNQDVSENEEVAKKDNYILNIGKEVTSVKVDGNTAILIVEDGVSNQREAKLTISDKILGAKEEITFTFFDAELPEVTGLEVTGPKAMEISFTEPMAKVNNFNDVSVTIKSGTSTISINKSQIKGEGTRTLSFELYSSFVDGKEYQVTVENFVDYAGYKNKIATLTFVYQKDNTAPTAVVNGATQEYVKVTFNKPVTGLTPEHFSHTFSAWTAMSLTTEDQYADDNSTDKSTLVDPAKAYKTVYVWFYKDGSDKAKERPIDEGETSFRILTKANDKEIKDAWGNKFVENTYTISVTADKAAPEVKEIKVTGEDRFSVEFTKAVNFSKDNLEVLDSEGKEISGLTITVNSESSTKFTVILSKNLKGKTIIVNIKNVKDTTLNTNTLSLYSATLEIDDKTKPVVDKVTREITNSGKSNEARYLYVFFNEDVDADTALVAGNYFIKVGETFTKLTETAEFYAGNKIVKIALTKDQYNLVKDGTPQLFVTEVKDLAGNEIAPQYKNIIAQNDAANAPKIEKAEATAVNKVVVTFDQELSTYDESAFEVDGEAIAGIEDAVVNSDGKSVLTLALKDDAKLAYNTSGKKVKIVEVNAISNIFGINPASEQEEEIKDKIKPTFKEYKVVDDKAGRFTIEFEEPMKDNAGLYAYMTLDIVVAKKSDGTVLKAGTEYEVVDVDGNKLVVEIKNVEVDTTYKVYSKDDIAYIQDENGNLAEKFTSAKEVTVKGSKILILKAAQDAVAALFNENKDGLATDVDADDIDAAEDLVDLVDAEKYADEVDALRADITTARSFLAV